MEFFDSNNTQSFKDLIVGEDTYVDKTSQICSLYREHDTFEMLIRPHGFGKTVLLDTIYNIFRHGNEPMFDKLALKEDETKFPEQRVIKIDFSIKQFRTPSDFGDFLFNFYRARSFEFSLESHVLKTFSIYRQTLAFIKDFAKDSPTGKIVILIDNYDTPILNNLFNDKALKPVYEAMLDFYKALSDSDYLIDWCLICGESKFYLSYEKYEGINYINDITFTERSTTICGFTSGEMKKYYNDFIQDEADASGQTVEVFLGHLNDWYGNYRFTGHNIRVMRPASIKKFLNLRDQNQYRSFYPYAHLESFLPKLLKKYGRTHEKQLAPNDCSYNFCDYNSMDNIKMFALLTQLGVYTFSHIDIDVAQVNKLYKYYSTITNRELNDAYLQAINEANSIKDFQ